MFLIFSSQSEMGILRLAWESSGWMRMFTLVEMSLLLLVAVGDDFFVGSEMNGPFDPEIGSFQHLLPKVQFFTRRVHPQATPALVLAWKKCRWGIKCHVRLPSLTLLFITSVQLFYDTFIHTYIQQSKLKDFPKGQHVYRTQTRSDAPLAYLGCAIFLGGQ